MGDYRTAPIIDSPEEIMDQRARALVITYGLEISEIVRRSWRIQGELEKNENMLKVPSTPLNAHQTYIEDATCSAILNLELATRPDFSMPLVGPIGDVLGTSRGAFFDMRVPMFYIYREDLPAEHYERLGQGFLRLIETLRDHRDRRLDQLMDELEGQ
jgi:hypothetical protein